MCEGVLAKAVLGLMVVAAVAWALIDMVSSVLTFFFDHRGVAFYRERPHLFGLCLLVAVLAAVLIKVISERWWMTRPSTRNREVSKPVEGETIGDVAPCSSDSGSRNRPFPRWVWIVLSLGFVLIAFQFGSIVAYSMWLAAYASYEDGLWTRMLYFHLIGFCVTVCLAVATVVKAVRRPSG